ncbi:hypothetical protein [Haloarchaeobius sp. HME9146]|uniref:hypothetical protein n=1 Tax=Haloarchaeobius sp. HME9146 TaxID=2978732 RepID=UPI0021BFCE75|nr:hypothetical protein [Haloarchaeobius sp. HME9146]MCT9095358.1 hypothetical protein [Haloarchaeobius sp. HME9146]
MNYLVFLALVLLLFVGTFWVVTRVFEERTPMPPEQSSTPLRSTTGLQSTTSSGPDTSTGAVIHHELSQQLTDNFRCQLLHASEDGVQVVVTDGTAAARFSVTSFDPVEETATVDPAGPGAGALDGGQAGVAPGNGSPGPETAYGAFQGPTDYTVAAPTVDEDAGTDNGPDDPPDSDASASRSPEEANWHVAARTALETGFGPVFTAAEDFGTRNPPVFDVGDLLTAETPRIRALRDRFDHAHVDEYPEGHLVEVTDSDHIVQVLVPPDEPPRCPDPSAGDAGAGDGWVADALEYAAAIDLPTADEAEPITERE